jgi:hypothetical protein
MTTNTNEGKYNMKTEKDTGGEIDWLDRFLEMYSIETKNLSEMAFSLRTWRDRALAVEKKLDRESHNMDAMTARRDQWKDDCEKAQAELEALKAQLTIGRQSADKVLIAARDEYYAATKGYNAQLSAVTAERDSARAELTVLKAAHQKVRDERDSARSQLSAMTIERDRYKAYSEKLEAQAKLAELQASHPKSPIYRIQNDEKVSLQDGGDEEAQMAVPTAPVAAPVDQDTDDWRKYCNYTESCDNQWRVVYYHQNENGSALDLTDEGKWTIDIFRFPNRDVAERAFATATKPEGVKIYRS